MLEARKLTSGATARNGGHLKPDTYMGVTKLASLYGTQQVANLQKYEAGQVYAVKRLVEDEGLDCDFHLTRACDAIMDPDVAEQKAREYRQLVKEGVVDMRDVGYVPKKDAERISGVKGAQCCFTFTAGHVWPRKMMHQMLEKLIQQGLQVHAHTPVLELSATRDELGFWTVTTPRGAIKTKKIVVCTNAYTASVLPQYKNKIVPVRGVCCRISSPKGSKTPHLPCTYSLRFDALQYDYLVPRADGSIIVGGARQAFWHDRDSWWHNKNDDEQVKHTAEYFDNYMQRHFHDWEDSGAKLDRIWTGSMSSHADECRTIGTATDRATVMGYSSDLVPHVGEVPGSPGQFICAGFSGHGMPQIFGAGKGVARMVLEGIPFAQTGLPVVFQETQSRLDSTVNLMEDSLKVVWETPRAKL